MTQQGDQHVEAAKAAVVALYEEYAKPKDRQVSERIAAHHQAINYGLKMAEVYYLGSIARSLDALASAS